MNVSPINSHEHRDITSSISVTWSVNNKKFVIKVLTFTEKMSNALSKHLRATLPIIAKIFDMFVTIETTQVQKTHPLQQPRSQGTHTTPQTTIANTEAKQIDRKPSQQASAQDLLKQGDIKNAFRVFKTEGLTVYRRGTMEEELRLNFIRRYGSELQDNIQCILEKNPVFESSTQFFLILTNSSFCNGEKGKEYITKILTTLKDRIPTDESTRTFIIRLLDNSGWNNFDDIPRELVIQKLNSLKNSPLEFKQFCQINKKNIPADIYGKLFINSDLNKCITSALFFIKTIVNNNKPLLDSSSLSLENMTETDLFIAQACGLEGAQEKLAEKIKTEKIDFLHMSKTLSYREFKEYSESLSTNKVPELQKFKATSYFFYLFKSPPSLTKEEEAEITTFLAEHKDSVNNIARDNLQLLLNHPNIVVMLTNLDILEIDPKYHTLNSLGSLFNQGTIDKRFAPLLHVLKNAAYKEIITESPNTRPFTDSGDYLRTNVETVRTLTLEKTLALLAYVVSEKLSEQQRRNLKNRLAVTNLTITDEIYNLLGIDPTTTTTFTRKNPYKRGSIQYLEEQRRINQEKLLVKLTDIRERWKQQNSSKKS